MLALSLVLVPPLVGHIVHKLYKQEEYFAVFAKETTADGIMVNLILLSQVNHLPSSKIQKPWEEVRFLGMLNRAHFKYE